MFGRKFKIELLEDRIESLERDLEFSKSSNEKLKIELDVYKSKEFSNICADLLNRIKEKNNIEISYEEDNKFFTTTLNLMDELDIAKKENGEYLTARLYLWNHIRTKYPEVKNGSWKLIFDDVYKILLKKVD